MFITDPQAIKRALPIGRRPEPDRVRIRGDAGISGGDYADNRLTGNTAFLVANDDHKPIDKKNRLKVEYAPVSRPSPGV